MLVLPCDSVTVRIAVAFVLASAAWAGPAANAGGGLAEADGAETGTALGEPGVRQPPDALDGEEAESDSAVRTELNLLGEVDSESGESRRNENVQLTLVDNNALKELNIRLGTTATIVREFEASQGYFGSEFGNPPARQIHLRPAPARRFRGRLHETHGNSAFSARSFFQVGSVKPANYNDYGANLSVPLPLDSGLSVELSQQRNRGNVNGNVLIPLPEERTPLAKDPELRAIVSRLLSSYPDEPPNRPDIDPRAHNTNATQLINNDIAGGRYDLPLGTAGRVSADYRFRRQAVDAFQLVKGQNPNTTTGSHDGRMSWNRPWSAATVSDLSVRFRRTTSLIVQDETAIGPFFFLGRQLESIGGTSSIPFNRAQNFFRYAGAVSSARAAHRFVAGFDVTREQLNGIESSGHAGLVLFSADFGRDLITNLRMGTPSRVSWAIGSPYRGFRRWRVQSYFGDAWQALPDLTLSFGVRYGAVTRPVDVYDRSDVPFGCDCNNVAPRFGFAYRTGAGVLRGAYGTHFGEIFTATYTQERFNPPGNIRISAVAPDLLDPLAGLALDSAHPSARTSLIQLAPDLVAPYSHHYNFSWILGSARGLFAELGYLGSRSHRLLAGWVLNRAVDTPGIERSTRTVNLRRPDPRYFDVRRILNGSRAYYDSAKATVGLRGVRGLTMDCSYWLSKAIDLGAHYASTASTRDAFNGRSQTEAEVHGDVKALSDFDQPHAFLSRVSYRVPRMPAGGPLDRILSGWEFNSVVLVKTGTPFILYTGSDGPGFGNIDGVMGDRPNILDPSILGRRIDHPDTSRERMPRSAFGFVGLQDAMGNVGRNVLRKDAIQNVNVSVSRSWKVMAEGTITFRAESINLFNTPQFANPGNDFSGANFGQITNTLNDGRTFNLAMVLEF